MTRADRRLAAIVAADVVGYSRLVEEDEAGTLARLATLHTAIVEPLLAEHRGRVVKLLGDGFLAEFASVVDAVACAVAIQERNAAGSGGGALALRIGINLGDVVVDGSDLFGDGVNIASRLEGQAEPGGIVVSGTAWDQLHGKLALRFESLGELHLKNIARSVRAYRLTGRGGPGAAVEAPLPSGLSIAVLPFDNLSGDPDQTYFSDGITEDLLTELSRYRDLRVAARHSSFALRGQALDAGELGRRLGVRFLLEGSVRKMGPRVRITAQLIETATGAHLWAERYDRSLDDIFAVQDEVVATIAATLMGRLEAASLERARRKPTADLAAYDLVLQGMERLAAFGPGTNAAARRLFEQAVALDPNYAVAHAYLALAIFNQDWSTEKEASLALCLQHARRALELDADDSRCHRVLSVALLFSGEHDRAEFHSLRSLALNPNDPNVLAYRATLLSFTGRAEEAVAMMRRAIELNRFHLGFFLNALGRALQSGGHYAEAIAAFANSAELLYHHHARLAICHAKLGHADEARRCVERTLALRPAFSSRVWTDSLPFRDPADRAALLADLLEAGLPA